MAMEKLDVTEATVVARPRDVVAQAQEQAKVLLEIVEAQGLYANIQGKRYLMAEAWETIGAFNHVGTDTEWVKPIVDPDGKTTAWEAKVNLVHRQHGNTVGSAIMSCGMDEFPTKGKSGEAANKAARSAAQTWAASKAYRMNYSWVVVLAGFEPTPASEMMTDSPPAKKRQQQPQEPRTAPEQGKSGVPVTLDDVEPLEDIKIQHAGHLAQMANEKLGMGVDEVAGRLGVQSLREIEPGELQAAWNRLLEARTGDTKEF